MEKFFIIREGTKLHSDYWEWKNSISKNNEIVVDFFEKYGIDAIKYYISHNRIGIIPTMADKEKFENQFTKYDTEDDLRWFKRNSIIGKAWNKQAINMKILHKPSPSWYSLKFVDRCSSRLFDHNGILYCSISAENVEMQSDIFQEIKGSEFYAIIEEIESKRGEDNG